MLVYFYAYCDSNGDEGAGDEGAGDECAGIFPFLHLFFFQPLSFFFFLFLN